MTNKIQNEHESTVPDKGRIKLLISQLRDIDTERNKNIFIRTHNEVVEPSERPSKYFFSQLKTQQKKKEMPSLKNEDGQRLTDQSNILDETVNYYTNLYTAEKELNKTEQEIFLNNVHRQLSESDKRELESNLSLKELKEALDDAENEKSPGCDGLPYEFYKQFWSLLGNDLLETVT